MSKTLSIVGILAIIAGAGIFTAVGQTDPADLATTVPNHISDDERDRLMKEAIEKAKAQESDKDNNIPSTPTPAPTPNPTPRPTVTPAPSPKLKAELSSTPSASRSQAESLADDANFPKAKPKKDDDAGDDSAYNLKPLKLTEKTVDLDAVKTPTPAQPTATPRPATVRATVTPKVTVTEATPRPVTAEKSAAQSDTIRDSDKAISFKEKDGVNGSAAKVPSQAMDSGNSLRGRVVGIMMPAGRGARILVLEYSGRQVEVTLDDGLDVPAPQSTVALKGRETSNRGMGLRTFEASSVRLESGTFMQKMPTRQPVPMGGPGPMMPGPFMPGPPMMAPPMMAPPPPF